MSRRTGGQLMQGDTRRGRATKPAGVTRFCDRSPVPQAPGSVVSGAYILVRSVALLAGVLWLVVLRLVGLLEVDDLIEDGREKAESRSAERA